MSFLLESESLTGYAVVDTSRIVTPALLIYPAKLHHNIRATIRMAGNDPNRWRPHIKTAKLIAVVKSYIREGVRHFKCSTTLELLMACQAGADDVLVAFAMAGANALRAREIAAQYPRVRISVLAESAQHAALWSGGAIGVFIDLNSGMNRTGMEPGQTEEIIQLARTVGASFRGLHWYDGHITSLNAEERKEQAFAGYDRLMNIVSAFERAGVPIGEVVTSGTPAAPYGYAYAGFTSAAFVHRISPGTVVYNDLSSLTQLSGYGYLPAAVVMTTVISRPKLGVITCDAGHKAVSVDSGVPNCAVIGHPELTPLKPSEEHLPMEVQAGFSSPGIGEKLYLVPRHVCPTVNNFDHALVIEDGLIASVEPVTARGHEHPLCLVS